MTSKILIVSTGKTGSTALFFRLKNSLGRDVLSFFEPPEITPEILNSSEQQSVIAKVLFPIEPKDLSLLSSYFSKRILLIRDPRDIIISMLLYTTAYSFVWKWQDADIESAIHLLKLKESSPGDISVLMLFSKLWHRFDHDGFVEFIMSHINQAINIACGSDFYYCFRYEDLINNRLLGIEEYLGFSMTQDDKIDPNYNRVTRTKSSENWRDWFLQEDVDFFKPLFLQYMHQFDYPGDDWIINDKQTIFPQFGSEYFLKVVNERRCQEGLKLIV